ncbi:putative phosphatase YkrA [Arthrobacter sp. Hiyo4]|nr:putative phosphatase YkrA [Arthrobacter sp. Hiyo4]
MTTLTETTVAGIDDQRIANENSTTKFMVALDVDGTLVDHDGHMSVSVREAAQAVVGAGHDVLIATGRSLNATLPIIEQIGIDRGYAVCCNGGVTLRLDPDLTDGYEIIHKATFDPAPALRALRQKLPTAKYALEDEDGNFLSTERFQDASFGVEAIGVDFQTLLEATAVRLVVFSTENTRKSSPQPSRRSDWPASPIRSAGPRGWTSPPPGLQRPARWNGSAASWG